jgi:hypothetical protein
LHAVQEEVELKLTIITPHPPFFRMCGKERTCGRVILYVWQAKELHAHFSDVWQGKELGREMACGEWASGEKTEERPRLGDGKNPERTKSSERDAGNELRVVVARNSWCKIPR